jgi:serine phosphatase RsbU (regulator of sigma subunit)
MTVSLLIGTLLTLSESTHSPAQLLAALNLRAISRSSSGFTTCLILHAQPREDSGATLTIANAGHLSPYRNGPQLTTQELVLDNGLPLGLAESSIYPEVCFELAAGEQLTLLTDGVLEAHNPTTGELYGFDRTALVSTRSAAAIAGAAQQWGQEDDITVLTIRIATPDRN